MRYRKKPVVIEALRFESDYPPLGGPGTEKTGERFAGFEIYVDESGPFLLIRSPSGLQRCNHGDWLITGVEGERYPCSDSIFQATYEPA